MNELFLTVEKDNALCGVAIQIILLIAAISTRTKKRSTTKEDNLSVLGKMTL